MAIKSTQRLRPLALALSVMGVAATVAPDSSLAQAAAEPGYVPSRHRGVVVRRVPAPPTATANATIRRRPNRGLQARGTRRLPGGGVVIEIDPTSFPAQVAHASASGEVHIDCTDEGHSHGAARPAQGAAKGARAASKSVARSSTPRLPSRQAPRKAAARR